ncbi:MAG TPA: hypothetical protein VEL31_09640 [Ktedonobacteraceae bacterium]|nr:hypothetical protein [Ktedonobacteraceae bacterium]
MSVAEDIAMTAIIADHPIVELHFSTNTARWNFARYYMALQARSETLLSLLDTIEHYRCAPIAELVKEMKA